MNTAPLISRQGLGTPVQVLLRLLLGAAVLLPLAVVYGEALVNTWLAAYRVVFSWVADDFKLLNLYIDHEGADRVLRARVMWQHIVFIGGKVIYPDPRGTANASTLLAHALQGPLVAMLAAIAWPTRAQTGPGKPTGPWLEWAARAIALLPPLAVLVLIDMPVVLAGELWELALDALDPGATSALVIWKQFMQGGGRYALGLAAGVLAVLAARRLSQFVGRGLPAGSSAVSALTTSSST
jgi:hypothetical protein